LVRQLYELKIGTRRGVMSRFMRPVVTDLSTLDMLNIAAYVGSLAPPPRESVSMQSASRWRTSRDEVRDNLQDEIATGGGLW